MKRHVLVIDHEPLVRNQIVSVLEQRAFTCDQAATLDEAATLLNEHHYHLLMLDLMLQDENGFEALAYIRENYPEASRHTVVMTNAERKFVENLPSDGWCAVLLKPFSAPELLRVIEMCIGDGHTAGVAYH